MKIIREIHPEITFEKVCRLLGRGKRGHLSKRLLRRVDRSIEAAYELIGPAVVYTEKKIQGADNGSLVLAENMVLHSRKLTGTLGRCDRAAIFIATIGRGIDSLIQRLIKEKKLAEAYIFDAIGSIAAEETVEKFHRMCDRLFAGKNEVTTLRFSPGYCDWKVQEQRKIFDLMDNGSIGVHLTESCLMTPRKSVSGVFGIACGKQIAKNGGNPCLQCGMLHCMARRTDG